MGPLVVAFETVLPLFLVIFAGVLFSRTKASSEHWIDILNKYALWIGFPALVITSEVYGHHKINVKELLLSLLKNPLLLSVFAGLTIVLFNISLPDFLEKTIGLFSDSVTAVVLFSLGIFLGMHQLGNIREWKQVLVWSVVAMIILPAAFYLIIRFLPMPEDQVKASILDAAMPLGLTPYALSIQYKLKTTLMARIVVLSTLLSMIIIPLWMVVTG